MPPQPKGWGLLPEDFDENEKSTSNHSYFSTPNAQHDAVRNRTRGKSKHHHKPDG